MRVEREIHGVPAWLLEEYLQSLGGEIGEGRIHGRGWEAWIEKIAPYRIGSLSVGRVRLTLEGDPVEIEQILDKLAWKTLRGGG
ncbi:MAG: hypothetical protein ANABAC_2733 [Anaerolineae bacterium]|jgi:hypothetical protein|nr:MAG: hypothetical protein ANABAC_2733 [Anaerolineae bacterium]